MYSTLNIVQHTGKDLYRVSDFVMLKGPKIKSSIIETSKNYKETDETKKMRKD